MTTAQPATLRQDIQQLRGIAVLAVIINHLGIGWLPGGYLGVDMFFVVSGFVITLSMLGISADTEQHARGFFAQFWIRRMFRLWPMLFITVLVTLAMLLATGLATPGPIFTGLTSLVAASNFRLMLGRLDYFSLDTGSDWFMHTWSLAVEEQVYVVLSVIFAVFGGGSRLHRDPRRYATVAVVLGGLATTSVVLAFAPFTTELVRFYAPHTRLYQIVLGAILAMLLHRRTVTRRHPNRTQAALVVASAAMLVTLFITNMGAGAVASLASSILTVALLGLATARQQERGIVRARWLGKVGDWSYSLYLVHWPVFLFWETVASSKSSVVAGSICTTFSLGALANRLVENPVRHSWRPLGRPRAAVVALTALVVAVGVAWTGLEFAERRATPPTNASGELVCSADRSPVWVVGDSHFNTAPIDKTFGTILNGECTYIGGYGTVIDYKDLARSTTGQRQLRIQLIPIDRLIETIRSSPQPPAELFIIHFLTAFLSDPGTAPASADFVAVEWQDTDGSLVPRKEFIRLFEANLSRLAAALDEFGGILVVTSPPPDFDWLTVDIDPAECADRLIVSRQCSLLKSPAEISRSQHDTRGGEVRAALDAVAERTSNFIHLALDSPFCDANRCRNFRDGMPLYMDDDHLNSAGAALVEPFFRTLLDDLMPDGPRGLTCPQNASVYSCRMTIGGGLNGRYSVPAPFVEQPTSRTEVARLTYTDSLGGIYCVALNDADEATFAPGACAP